jgi:hypothetical protein
MNTSKLETLLDNLDSSRERLLVALELLPDEALLVKNAVGDWSVADLLAILTAWEAELVTGLMRLAQGKKPERLLRALANPQAYNAQVYDENQGRDLDQIFDDFQRVRVQVEEWLEHFSEGDLTNPKRYASLRGRALSEIVARATFAHEASYLEQLGAFSQAWLDDEPDASPLLIPLTAVDALPPTPESDPFGEETPHDDHSTN